MRLKKKTIVWMNHKKCIKVLENLHHGKEITKDDISPGGDYGEKYG